MSMLLTSQFPCKIVRIISSFSLLKNWRLEKLNGCKTCLGFLKQIRLWCWEGLGAEGEGDDRGWDGWMASLTLWTRVWVNSGSWWWTGRPGVLRFVGSQRVGHDWATELNWTELPSSFAVTPWSTGPWHSYDSALQRRSWYVTTLFRNQLVTLIGWACSTHQSRCLVLCMHSIIQSA